MPDDAIHNGQGNIAIDHAVTHQTVTRLRWPTRLWHWTNAIAIITLFMSGLMIFNAHPRLYWGEYGARYDPSWLEIKSVNDKGMLRIGPVTVETTGVLGLWIDSKGAQQTRAFPGWITIPSSYDLAAARRWHFLFAWLLALPLAFYMLWALFSGHIQRLLHMRLQEWQPRHLWQEMRSHARLRFPKGQAALSYNSLQKISYIGVIFILLPLMICTGLAMSPGMNASWPWLLDIFGGRQSARSLHFIAAFALCGFFIIHILMVIASGPIKGLRSIITGRHVVEQGTGT